MAVTTGQYNSFVLTAQDVIGAAMKRIRQLPAGGAPSVADLTDGMLELNALLQSWRIKGLLLWCYDLIQIPLVQNQFRYTLGPGGDFPDYRPLRALEGSYIRYTCQPCPPDTQLQLLSRLEYLQYSVKCTTGVPNSFYYDVQMGLNSFDPSQSQGVLYIFTAPSDSTRTIFLNVQRPIQDVYAAGQTFDLPTEWYHALVKCLAAEIADYYEVPEDRIRRVKQEAKLALDEISDWGVQEWAPMFFQPDYQFGMYGQK